MSGLFRSLKSLVGSMQSQKTVDFQLSEMANTHEDMGEINDGSSVVMRGGEEGTSHATFTEEQMEILEKIYAECSFPNQFQLSKVLLEEPFLSDVSMMQLRLWFKNRRYHERLKRENEELATVNKWLAAGNNLLRRKMDALQAQDDQLIFDNEFPQIEPNLINPIIAEAELNLQPEATDSEGSSTISDDNDSLPSLADETEDEFLSEAIGTAINCDPIPRPLKNYAPTTMACAQDFWTMRSSAIFSDGSLLVPQYVLQLAAKSDVKMGFICSSQPICLRSFSEKLSRGFNVDVLMEAGWRWMGSDSSTDIKMSIEQTNRFGANATIGGFICKNVPVSLRRLLKECCSARMNANFANQSIAFSEAARHALTLNRTELEDEVGGIFFMQINGHSCSVLIFGSIGICLLGSNTVEYRSIFGVEMLDLTCPTTDTVSQVHLLDGHLKLSKP